MREGEDGVVIPGRRLVIDENVVRAPGTQARSGSWATCHGGTCRGTRASGVQHLRPGEWRSQESEV